MWFQRHKLILAGAYKEPDGKTITKTQKLIGNNTAINCI